MSQKLFHCCSWHFSDLATSGNSQMLSVSQTGRLSSLLSGTEAIFSGRKVVQCGSVCPACGEEGKNTKRHFTYAVYSVVQHGTILVRLYLMFCNICYNLVYFSFRLLKTSNQCSWITARWNCIVCHKPAMEIECQGDGSLRLTF